MSSKKDLQLLNDAAHHTIEQARAVQNGIKRLTAAKKDSDVKQQQQSLVQLLRTLDTDIKDFHEKAAIVHQELETELEKSKNSLSPDPERHEGTTPGDASARTEDEAKRLPNPEDQENAYQWKARMMPQLHFQNKMLEAEMILKNKRDGLRALRKERQVNYNRETNLSAKTTLQVIALHERKAREAEARADALQAQLDQKHGGRAGGGGQTTQSADANRHLNNVARKNQQLMEENHARQKEIERLKRDNAELIKKVKHAEQDRHHVMSQLSTSEMAKKDLSTRLQKQKTQLDRLSRSLTKQSSDWLESKKNQSQEEEEWRWKNVGHAAPHGASERTFSHPVPRNVDQPRNMYPVQHYALPSVA